jgi:hypothetical protein
MTWSWVNGGPGSLSAIPLGRPRTPRGLLKKKDELFTGYSEGPLMLVGRKMSSSSLFDRLVKEGKLELEVTNRDFKWGRPQIIDSLNIMSIYSSL